MCMRTRDTVNSILDTYNLKPKRNSKILFRVSSAKHTELQRSRKESDRGKYKFVLYRALSSIRFSDVVNM